MAAARFFEESGHCQRKAGAALLKHLQGDGPPRPGRFCKRWWAKLQKYNSVEDLPRKGRSRKLPSRVVEEIAEKVIGKPTPNGKAQYYGSMGSSLKQHLDLAQQVKEAGVQKCTIVRSIKRVEPKLMRKSVRIRKELAPKNVEARRRVAAQLMRLAQYKRRATIFVDESSFEFQLPNVDKAWGHMGGGTTSKDKFPCQQEGKNQSPLPWCRYARRWPRGYLPTDRHHELPSNL
jgi:hypothetical protein